MAIYIDDKYRVIRKISGGNMSQILLCDDDAENRVVLKMFDKSEGNNLQETIFKREVESLETVRHQNIVTILNKGIDEKSNKFYIVLEYVEGKNFDESFQQLINYEFACKVELMEDILKTIEFLHRKNIIHRDLKPSNLMLTIENKVKVIDFGISKLNDTFYSEFTVCNYSTPKYCSPEQDFGRTVTYQSDIYSLGLVFYELFKSEKIQDKRNLCFESLSFDVAEILKKMLSSDTNLRYQSVIDVIRDVSVMKSKFKMEKYINFGLTNKISSLLYQYGYIERDELSLAASILEKDFCGKVYIRTNRNQIEDVSYTVIGKQFITICKIDMRNSEKFTLIGIKFSNSADVNQMKENSYEIPYRVKVGAMSSKILLVGEVDANTIIEEIIEYESKINIIKNDNINKKDFIAKWSEILNLQKKKLEIEKATIRYNNFTYNARENSIEVELAEGSQEVGFSSDDMLTMTMKNQIHKSYSIGYMREVQNGKMIIDLDRNALIERISESGELSINRSMMEIALSRQTRALKNLRFKEIVNPNISDIIFNPEMATSKDNIILYPSDCGSNLIDKSKLESLEKALAASDLFLLQGPPGTGKTSFISELVYQILKNEPNSKILIASQSHVAVDHSLTKIKLIKDDIKMIRIGIKEKFSENVIQYTLDAFCKEWTLLVIEKCKVALKKYKDEVGIDESIQEKNNIIFEIDQLMEKIDTINSDIREIEIKEESLTDLLSKWSSINEKIESMKNLLRQKSSNISDVELSGILENFSLNIDYLNNSLSNVLDKSIDIVDEKKYQIRKKEQLKEEKETCLKEINVWNEELGIKSESDYLELKALLKDLQKENQLKYNQISKIDKLCLEWIERVQLGNGLLQESLADATIVGATCLGIASLGAGIDLKFDWVIVDEAGKATPPEILVPIGLGKKIVLVGDHKQLPPVVDETLIKYNTENKLAISKKDLETSMFEYIEQNINASCKSLLNEQYRMNPTIGELISQLFYDGKLISKTSKEEKSIPLKLFSGNSLIWLSTSGMNDSKEEIIKMGQNNTYRNRCEANIVFEYLLKIDSELGELKLFKEVSIIAGYRAQRDLFISLYESQFAGKLQNMKVEINTVDAFQGRETDIVFYSVVRSNDEGKLGFLQDVRRLNVAFSRAKELLIVVGNHLAVTKKTMHDNNGNPFVGILQYIYSNPKDCQLKEVK